MSFIHADFLLHSKTARHLYHAFAETLPIIDYHCHLEPEAIAKNISFNNITELWLARDHYKWTAMRSYGIDEKYITGSADDKEKFFAYAETLQYAIGNPLYHWSNLELKRYFNFDEPLTLKNAEKAWDWCNERLNDANFTAKNIISDSNVRFLCTTDDPIDTLCWHEEIKNDISFNTKVIPTFRPDRILNIYKAEFPHYIEKLSAVTGKKIKNIDDLYSALTVRLDFFVKNGCRLADHGITMPVFSPVSETDLNNLFSNAMSGITLSTAQIAEFQTAMLLFFGREYKKRDWAMQIHYGVLRDVNSRLFFSIGEDAGGDVIGAFSGIEQLALFMNELDKDNNLPRTVLYSINPTDNTALDALIGVFQTGEARGKVQHGPAWWFNDSKPGIEAHLKSLATCGVLGNFIGMLTDSRSFISYVRHDYFRRILCDLLGSLVEKGEYPNDNEMLSKIICDICYNNAFDYFKF